MIKVRFKNFVVSSMLNLLLVTIPPISGKQNKHRERVQVYRNVDCYVVCSHTGCKEMTDSLLVIKSCLTLAIQYPSATVKLNRLS